ncbi:MAG: hypothetical protein L0Z53_04480, partial [Acidobacteriales bacterium]|nr:hypothetical protein [Terriglobales bacterium]
MNPFSISGSISENSAFEMLWEDCDRILCRISSSGANGDRYAFLAGPSVEHPSLESINRLTHEHGLKDFIDGAWAV